MQSWFCKTSAGMYDSAHFFTCAIAALFFFSFKSFSADGSVNGPGILLCLYVYYIYLYDVCVSVCLRILCGKTERDAFFFFLFFSSPGWVQLTLPPNWTFLFSNRWLRVTNLFKYRARARTRESRSLNDDKTETHERALKVARHHLSQRGGARKRQRRQKRRRCRSWAVWRTTF